VLSLGSLTGCFAGVRVYDGPHGDYHRWNDREERAYRVYLADQHRDYREFNRLERPEQDRYWSWRHDHRDADLRRP
jgi:hypothetical protein